MPVGGCAVSSSEVSVCDSYMGQIFAKYEFCNKTVKRHRNFHSMRTSLSMYIKSAFLPEGYPTSVSSDYLEYQIWDTVQAVASSILSTLAGQAILVGVGVGDGKASLLAASITWLFKDGAGMVGSIVFAGWQGIFADVLNDFAFFLEIVSLHTQSVFTPIVCTSSVMRALVGMVGGATRASVTQHQALKGNMADVAAKDGSQETLSNLLALIVNLILITLVTGNLILIWLLFFVLTPIHVYANWRAVRCLEFNTLNRARFSILVQDWLRQHDETSDHLPSILSVSEVNYREPILWPFGSDAPNRTIYLGCSFERLFRVLKECKPQPLLGVFSEERYILYCPEWRDSGYRRRRLTFYICLQTDASSLDVLKAMFHAEIICGVCNLVVGLGDFKEFWKADDGLTFFAWTLGRATYWMPRLMRSFEEAASKRDERKWDLSILRFDPDPWRISCNLFLD